MENLSIIFGDYSSLDISGIFLSACSEGRLDIVQTLTQTTDKRYRINIEKDGYDALINAIYANQGNIVEYLLFSPKLEKKPKYNVIKIFEEACSSNADKVLELIIKDAKNKEIPLSYSDGFSLACSSASTDVIRFFITNEETSSIIAPEKEMQEFERALRKNNLATTEFFLFDDSPRFNMNPHFYLSKRRRRGFDPIFPKYSIPVENMLVTAKLNIDFNLKKHNEEKDTVSKRTKI
jgi:ankyrin repeat protein